MKDGWIVVAGVAVLLLLATRGGRAAFSTSNLSGASFAVLADDTRAFTSTLLQPQPAATGGGGQGGFGCC